MDKTTTAQVAVKARGVSDDEIRIVMIGKTGCGKSATGNTILGLPGYFDSGSSGESITIKCKRGEKTRFGRPLMVVDTPGLFDTGLSHEVVSNEIVKCIGITSPGPHAFLLVVQLGRITKEEQDTVNHFADMFEEQMYKYLIILFTRKDDLSGNLDDYIAKVPREFKNIVHKCGERYIAFNNKAPEETKGGDTEMLINMIEKMVHRNGGSCYTNIKFSEAELAIEKEMDLYRQEEKEKKDKEIKAMREEISLKYQHLIIQEKAERLDVEEQIKRLEDSRKRDEEKWKCLNDQLNDLQRQKERDEHRLREELEEFKRKQREFGRKSEHYPSNHVQMRNEVIVKIKTDLQDHERKYMRNTERDSENDRKENENENENRKVSAMVKQFEGIKKRQMEKLEEQNERKRYELREASCQREFKDNQEKIKEFEEIQKLIEMKEEQERRESERESQFRKVTESIRLRNRARDECENENKSMMSSLSIRMKKFANAAKSAFSFGKNDSK